LSEKRNYNFNLSLANCYFAHNSLEFPVLLGLHQAMCKQKYRMLFSPNHNRKLGPKGPSAELVHAIVEMKQQSPPGLSANR
jgi:hypothetical protein